jgi:hypothetical protein
MGREHRANKREHDLAGEDTGAGVSVSSREPTRWDFAIRPSSHEAWWVDLRAIGPKVNNAALTVPTRARRVPYAAGSAPPAVERYEVSVVVAALGCGGVSACWVGVPRRPRVEELATFPQVIGCC